MAQSTRESQTVSSDDVGISDLSLDQVADRARRARMGSWASCTKEKLHLIENRRRAANQDELNALAVALETTSHWLTSGQGVEEEPVLIVGATARANVRGIGH